MKFKMIHLIFPIAVLSCMATAHANDIRSVIAVNDRTIEVQMEEQLPKEELDINKLLEDNYKSPFEIDPSVEIIGVPVLVENSQNDNVYRISVSLLSEYTLYRISYEGKRKRTFLTYNEQQTEEHYKKRYGETF